MKRRNFFSSIGKIIVTGAVCPQIFIPKNPIGWKRINDLYQSEIERFAIYIGEVLKDVMTVTGTTSYVYKDFDKQFTEYSFPLDLKKLCYEDIRL